MVVCGSGSYFLQNKKCYEVHKEKLTWEEAKQSCKDKGGELATAKDTIIHGFLMRLTQNIAWIGGYKNEEQWGWVDNSTWSFWYGFWYNESLQVRDAKGQLQ